MCAVYVEIYLRLLPSNRESRKMCDVIPKEPHSPDWSPVKPRLFDRRSRGGRRHLNRAQIFVMVSIKCISRNFDIGDLRSGQFCDLSIISQWEKKMKGASFARKPLKTLSNIELQVELTSWIGILRPVTPRLVAKVISGHERSPAVFRQ